MRLRPLLASAAYVAGTLIAGSSAFAQTTAPAATPSAVSPADRSFFVTAAQDGAAEVELGKLAQQKGGDAVKSFAAEMVNDHSKAGDELKALAGMKGVTLPATPGPHQKDIDRLAKKSGSEFDRDYAKLMVDAHQKAVATFEKASKSASDQDVKAFAGKTLPTLKQHLEHAKTMEASVRSAKQAG